MLFERVKPLDQILATAEKRSLKRHGRKRRDEGVGGREDVDVVRVRGAAGVRRIVDPHAGERSEVDVLCEAPLPGARMRSIEDAHVAKPVLADSACGPD